MAWEGIVAALDDARVNEQQVVESEHLMKALLEEKNGLAGRIFAKAGLPKASVLQATVDFKSQPPKVKGETSELIIGKHLGLVLNNAGKHRKEMGDDFISVEHLVLAFNSDERFGQQLFKSLQLSKKDVKYAIQAVRGNQRETDQSPKGKNRVLDMYGIDLTELARRGKFDPVIGREDEIKRCTEILSSKKKNNPVLIGEPGVGKTAIVEGLAQKIVHRKVPESLLNTKLISLDMGSLVAGTEHRGDFGKRLKAVLEKVTTSNGQIILFIDEVHTIVGAGDSSGAMNAGNLLKPMLGQGELRCIGATTLKEYTKYIEKDPALERRFQPVFCSQPSVEDTISILHGLQESYELHHGVKISNSALVSAAVLANRYITHRFFPDKAISLIDEAAAHLKTEITFMPTELEEIDRVVAKLEIEKFSLRNDRDEASKERSRKLEHDLRLLNEKQKELTEEWNHEKSLMTRMQSINEAAERELNMNCSAKHKCRTLISLYYQLEETKKNLHDFQKSANSFLRDEVTDDDIAQVVRNWTGIPLSNLQQSEKDKLFLLEQVLHKRVIGQNIAVTSIAKAIRRSRAGLSNPNRPTASFLFMGPTGVGKTELAKALASYLFNTENALVRIDMSEYMEKHSVSRLVGAPPGYAGYEEGGQLTEVVRRRPYSIVLFDEIEKAHRDISNILLQVLDDGRITDSQGRTVNFTNCIVIMTSNIGSDHILEKFSNMKDSKDVVYELMREEVVELAMKTFRREFMSRIGNHIIFLPLDSTEICMVAEIQIKQLRDRLQQKNINLLCTKEAIELIGTLGFDPRNGARLLRRIIEELVEDELAEQILSGSVKGNDTIIIDVDVSSTTEDLPPKKRLHIKKLESESISDDIVAED